MVLSASLWSILQQLVGLGLIASPALGTGIRASSGTTPTDFAAALYYSAYSLTTLGTGDLVPQTGFFRLLMAFEAAVGFSVSVYSALVRRNTFGTNLHHRTASTGNVAEFLARLGAGGDFDGARQELSSVADEVANLYESHNFYLVLHYFRFSVPLTHWAGWERST